MSDVSDDLVFTNVNEDGVPYGTHDNLNDAVEALDEFPNDIVVVTVGPYHLEL